MQRIRLGSNYDLLLFPTLSLSCYPVLLPTCAYVPDSVYARSRIFIVVLRTGSFSLFIMTYPKEDLFDYEFEGITKDSESLVIKK